MKAIEILEKAVRKAKIKRIKALIAKIDKILPRGKK